MSFLKQLFSGFNWEFFYGWFFELTPLDTFGFVALVIFCVLVYIRYGLFSKKRKRKKQNSKKPKKEMADISEDPNPAQSKTTVQKESVADQDRIETETNKIEVPEDL